MTDPISISSRAAPDDRIADAIVDSLISPNEADSNFEVANVTDGLFAIARAINRLATAPLPGKLEAAP